MISMISVFLNLNKISYCLENRRVHIKSKRHMCGRVTLIWLMTERSTLSRYSDSFLKHIPWFSERLIQYNKWVSNRWSSLSYSTRLRISRNSSVSQNNLVEISSRYTYRVSKVTLLMPNRKRRNDWYIHERSQRSHRHESMTVWDSLKRIC